MVALGTFFEDRQSGEPHGTLSEGERRSPINNGTNGYIIRISHEANLRSFCHLDLQSRSLLFREH